MAFNRYKYFKDGFLDFTKLDFESDEYQDYVIPMEFEGRPDLISFNLYGDTSYQTLLIYLNRIHDTPEGFTKGRVIKCVSKSFLE